MYYRYAFLYISIVIPSSSVFMDCVICNANVAHINSGLFDRSKSEQYRVLNYSFVSPSFTKSEMSFGSSSSHVNQGNSLKVTYKLFR